jgi:serine/threonine protein kinase
MEITICDQSTKAGRKGCFNLIAPSLQPYAGSCVVQSVGSDLHPVNSHDFFDRLTRDGIWCKIFTIEDEFLNELENIYTIKELYGNHFETYTTFYEYNGFNGFKIEIKDGMMFKLIGKKRQDWEKNATPIIYVSLQHKCNAVNISSDFEKLVNDTTPVLDLLHEKNYAHMDILPQNIVSCDSQFKIIDYGDLENTNNNIKTRFGFLWRWLERDRLSRMKFILEWPRQWEYIDNVAPVGVIVAVGLCTWWLHDQMIVNKKK